MKRLTISLFALLMTLACFAQQQPASPAPGGAFEVRGTVVHSVTGEPLAGVTLTLSPAQSFEPDRPRPIISAPQASEIHPVVTAADGRFSFAGLKPGKYSLAAAKPAFSQQLYQQHEQFSTAIVVGPGKDSAGLLFRLEPDASIGGRIVDEHNEPVPGARVLLFRDAVQNGRRGIYRVQQTQSSDEGTYRFGHIRPGKVYLAISAEPWYAQYAGMRGRMDPGFRDGGGGAPAQPANDGSASLDVAFPVTFYPGVTDSARAEAIDLKPGQRESFDFALLAVPSLHVRVNTGAAEPGQFMSATLVQQIFDSPEMGQRGRNTSFAQGVTEISGLTPGHYLLQLHANSQNRFPPSPSAVREIDISSSMDINATEVPAGVNVTGVLRFDGPAPPDPPRLVLRRRLLPAPVRLQVGTKGEISSEVPVPPDTYDLSLPMAGYQITHIGVSGGRLNGQTVQVGASDVKLNVVAAKSSGRVEGVALKDGKPDPGVMLVLVPQDMERPLLYRRDQSDSDGTFLMTAVTPGKYTLVAIENGWGLEWSRPEVIRPYLAAGAALQVVVDGQYKAEVNVQ